jgi:hypothetical protein
MPSLAQLCTGALAIVLLADHFAPPGSAFSLRMQAGAEAPAPASLYNVNRGGKGDRLRAVQASEAQNSIATVEVVGLSNAGIVYRDQSGRELFRVDPVSNATLVTKDVVLPEVTIRENYRSPVRTLPVKTNTPPPPAGSSSTPAKASPIPDGCDPAFSPLAVKANVTGRCVASVEVPTRLAMALQ